MIDPLADPAGCARDIPHIVNMGINTLFISDMSYKPIHWGCMQQLQTAGLYVIPTWSGGERFRFNGELRQFADYNWFKGFQDFVDSFHTFPNVISFLHETFDYNQNHIEGHPWIKTVVRAIKRHIKQKGYRQIPIGLSGYNHRKSKYALEYNLCGDEEETKPDWYALHLYNYQTTEGRSYDCDNSTVLNDQLHDLYKDSSIPLILGYFRCIQFKSEDFNEVSMIYSENMTQVRRNICFG
jgi:Glucanosyltransferase